MEAKTLMIIFDLDVAGVSLSKPASWTVDIDSLLINLK